MEENSRIVQFIFNTDKEVVAEKESEWTIYIRGSEILASSNDHARTYYHYANDEMGSCTHIVDDRKVLNEYEYDAWGNVTSQKETVKNRFKFNGQQLDPITQQYYLRARFYNPIVARFTQEDTYRGDGLNLYSYCANNPVYYVDPSGNACKSSKEIIKDINTTNELFLPDEYYENLNKKIHYTYQEPCTSKVYKRLGNRSNQVETSIVISDEFGRIKYRIDYTDHGRPESHTIPHMHEFSGSKTKGDYHISETKYFIDKNTGRMRKGKFKNGKFNWLD